MPVVVAEKDFAGCQLQGERALQEDAYAFSEIRADDAAAEGVLVVVADGMGGHAAGERASEIALKTFVDSFQKTSGSLGQRLNEGLEAANQAISEELERNPALEGMGTTLVAAAVTSAGLEWISVGDSPLYLLRGADLKRINADHSLRPILREVAERDELASQTQSADSLSGNILRSALMGSELELIDRSNAPFILQKDDLILVATDGIHSLDPREIVATCADPGGLDASVLADALIQAVAAAAKPKQDNTTVAIVKP
jgi:protein phosphatase